MNAIKKILIGSTLAAACSLASASAITQVVMGALKVTAGNPTGGTFDTTTAANPYLPGTPISSGTVTFTVSNTSLGNPPPTGGAVSYSIGGSGGTDPQPGTVTAGAGPTVIVLKQDALDDLTADGLLDLVLGTNDGGEFDVSGPFLEIQLGAPTQQRNDVPEPASLGLLGIALLGMAASRRKQQ